MSNLLKVAHFNIAVYLAPPLGVTLFKFCQKFCCQKATVSGQLCGALDDPIFSHFSRTLTRDRQTVKRTDGQTRNDGIYHANIALCGINDCCLHFMIEY